MPPRDDRELAEVLENMSLDIADLLLRMIESKPATWDQAKSLRDEIFELNQMAETNEEKSALLFAFHSLMTSPETLNLVSSESVDELKKVIAADYRTMMVVQASIDGMVDPDRLGYVTRREVEAGRLAADDDFRQFAEDGAAVLGTPVAKPQRRGWLSRLFGKK
jgi:hypothetical protein